MIPPYPKADLLEILMRGGDLWEALRGQRLFLTGGTGFFGSWILESLCFLNQRLSLSTSVVVLSRDPEGFRARHPHLAGDAAIQLVSGDVQSFAFPEGPFDLLVHAATTNARETFLGESALQKYDTLALGTRRVMDFAVQRAVQRMLFTSSGVVYGAQPTNLMHVPESFGGGPVPGYSQRALAEGKRAAEFLCSVVGECSGLAITIARCFSFVGPGLPLDLHYAIGNFMRDALAGRPIQVQGDGTAVRAYLYAADLTLWLWTMLLKGAPGAIYNVGSEEAVSIGELAHRVAGCAGRRSDVQILGQPIEGQAPDRYIPSVRKARNELGLNIWTGLEEAIRRTLAYHSQGGV